MDYLIRMVNYEEIDNAFSLIWNTFSEFVAPDYSPEGIKTFRREFIESKDFKERFNNGKQIMYGAYSEERLLGVISVSDKGNISCLFVDKEYHRRGIASMLFSHLVSILKEKRIETIALKASPYALPFYHAIGFKDIDKQQD
ncbi:MAG TPA: GNAT family N-acetyltransferase, partial [Clostridiales bacterium]|nr:GNAT family N-acetyltransferase [Clostridiales bacterium]